MKNFQILIYSFIGLFTYLFITAPAGAACTPIYGGGPTCTDNSLSIEEQVLNPNTNKYAHNLGNNDPKFQTNDIITFKVTLTNNGSKPIQRIIVKDTIPSVLTFTNGPGNFDKSNNLLTFALANLAPNKSQSFIVNTRVNSQNDLANNCLINSISELPSSGPVLQDSSQFCLGNLTTTPATGPDLVGLAIIPLSTLLGFGVKKLGRK